MPDFEIILNSRAVEHVCCKRDPLCIGLRRIGPDELHPELPELAVPSLLGAFVPETVGEVTPAQGFWRDLCLIDVHTDYRGGDLGSQGELPASFILKDIHLLDDPFPRPHGEKLEILEFRRTDFTVTPAARYFPHAPFDGAPRFHFI